MADLGGVDTVVGLDDVIIPNGVIVFGGVIGSVIVIVDSIKLAFEAVTVVL